MYQRLLKVLLLLSVCLPSVYVQAQGALKVAVVNYPLQYFAERVGGEKVEVLFAAPADEDPVFWQPSEDVVSEYQQADVILLNGATYAKWVKKVSLPRARLVDTGKAYREQLIQVEGPSHNHGPAGDHSHAGTAFTTWLDFQQAQQQVDAIVSVFSRQRPDSEALFVANAKALKADLEQLDQAMLALGQQLQGKAFVASHPVYQYLARRYQLQVTELLWEPEMMLDPQSLADLQAAIAQQPSQWMIWEGEPTDENRQTLAGLGVSSLVFAPLGNRPDEGDWLLGMQANIEQLKLPLAK